MFFYETTLERALNGIDGTAMLPTILNVSYSVLLVCFLFGVYQAFARGGDTRLLGITCMKYLAMGLGLIAYSTVFRSVNDMFNQLAHFIDSSAGAGDAFRSWFSQLSAYWTDNGSPITWQLLTTTFAALLNLLLMIAGYVIYPITYTLFAFFYAMYGSILYAVGPLVLALYPVIGIGQMARTYLINLMIFNGWGVIYTILGSLIAVINVNQVSDLMADQSFLGQFFGLGANTLIGLVSVIYALAIALIPFIAGRIVKGDVGGTMLTLIATAYTAAKTVPAAASGAAGGYNAGMNPGTPSSGPAQTPNQVTPGRYPGFNIAHGTGYAVGRGVGAIVKKFKG